MPICKKIAVLLVIFFLFSCRQPDIQTIEVERAVTVEVPVFAETIVTVEVPVVIEQVATVEIPVVIDTESEAISPEHDFSGIYLVLRDQEQFPGAGCQISIHHLKSGEPFDQLEFELNCNNGAPSYNIGYATDTILFDDTSQKTAVFSSDRGECHLVFEFKSIKVLEVVQIGEPFDCGFGGSVFANGTYLLQDTAVPAIGCLNPNRLDESLDCDSLND